jgi:hypothetical protein
LICFSSRPARRVQKTAAAGNVNVQYGAGDLTHARSAVISYDGSRKSLPLHLKNPSDSLANLLFAIHPGVAMRPVPSRISMAHARSVRAGYPKAIAFYEMQDTLQCLLDTSCYATKTPWFQLSDSFEATWGPRVVDGVTGGSFGVIAVLFFLRRKQDDIEEALDCVYCEGTGRMTCGKCLAIGSRVEDCSLCEGTGKVQCINCGGSGRTIPDELLQTLGDREDGLQHSDLATPTMELFIEKVKKKRQAVGTKPPPGD